MRQVAQLRPTNFVRFRERAPNPYEKLVGRCRPGFEERKGAQRLARRASPESRLVNRGLSGQTPVLYSMVARRSHARVVGPPEQATPSLHEDGAAACA
jgi:hypothetical protein